MMESFPKIYLVFVVFKSDPSVFQILTIKDEPTLNGRVRHWSYGGVVRHEQVDIGHTRGPVKKAVKDRESPLFLEPTASIPTTSRCLTPSCNSIQTTKTINKQQANN